MRNTKKRLGRNMCTDHFGAVFSSKTEMCRHYGISRITYYHRIKHGLSLREALVPPKGWKEKKRFLLYADHLGTIYKSLKEMCEHYHISKYTYIERIKHGWTIKDALTVPAKRGSGKRSCKDHLGTLYRNEAEMCRHYGIRPDTYRRRIKAGWKKAEALTTPAGKGPRHMTSGIKSRTDHFGIVYKSNKEMCGHYGIRPCTFTGRMKAGWQLKDSLTRSVAERGCRDHLGRFYESNKKMCERYGIHAATFRSRIKHGADLKKALTDPVRIKDCSDHLGNRYSSRKEMCAHYGVNVQTYVYRVKNGWSQEEALDAAKGRTEYRHSRTICIDHRGNTYTSTASMCRAYKISAASYRHRIRMGWTQKKALIIPTRKMKYAGFSVHAFSYEDGAELLYECTCAECGLSDILTYGEMENHMNAEHRKVS